MVIQQTRALFADDAYLQSCEAIVAAHVQGGFLTDQTVFYATSGGQPGDSGQALCDTDRVVPIIGAVSGDSKAHIIHQVAEGTPVPEIGTTVRLEIDFERRLKLMRMHTACHLLSVICPWPITGAGVGEEDSRVDFDLSGVDTPTRDTVTERLMELVHADHPVFTRWIDEAELDANPDIVRSKNVRPPRGLGRIRLVCIGENAAIDSQPCGGTHVRSTGEIGLIHIGKIENKGRENRRFRIRFGAPQ